MEESKDDNGSSQRGSAGDVGSHDSFKSTKTSFSSDQEATSFPNVPQRDDTNTERPLAPEKRVVGRHYRTSSVDSFIQKDGGNEDTGEQGSTGKPGPSVERKHNRIISLDSFQQKNDGDNTGGRGRPLHRPLAPEKRVVGRHYRTTSVDSFIQKDGGNEDTGEQGSTGRPESSVERKLNRSISLDSFQQKNDGCDNTVGRGRPLHRPLAPEKRVVGRHYRTTSVDSFIQKDGGNEDTGEQGSTRRPGPSVERKLNRSISLDSFQQKNDGCDNTVGRGRPLHRPLAPEKRVVGRHYRTTSVDSFIQKDGGNEDTGEQGSTRRPGPSVERKLNRSISLDSFQQKNDGCDNTVGRGRPLHRPLAPEKRVVGRHYRTTSVDSFIQTDGGNEDTGEQGSTGTPGPSVERKLNRSISLDSFQQKNDGCDNTVGRGRPLHRPLAPEKRVVGRHYRTTSVDSFIQTDGGNEDTGEQGSTGRPGPSVERKLNRSISLDSFQQKNDGCDNTVGRGRPLHRPLIPENRVVRRHICSTSVDSLINKDGGNEDTGEQGSTGIPGPMGSRIFPNFPKSLAVVSPSPLLSERGVAKRLNRSTSLDSFEQKDDGYDNTGGQGRELHSKFFVFEECSNIINDSKKSVAHPLNDGVSASSSDTKTSRPTFLGSPERLGPMEWRNLMSGQPAPGAWNSLVEQSIDHPLDDGASSDTKISHLPTPLVDRVSTITHTSDVMGALGSPERLGPMECQNIMSGQPATGTWNSLNKQSSSLSVTGGHHTERLGPSGGKSFMSRQCSMENSPERQIKTERVISERYHVLSIEDREPPRRNSFDSSMRIAAGGYQFADRQHSRVRPNQQNLLDRSNPLNTENLQNRVGGDSRLIGLEHVRDEPTPIIVRDEPLPPITVRLRDEPLPIISWVEEFGMIVVGVYLFCSTALFSTAYALNEGGWIALSIYLVFLFAALFTADIIPLCFEDVSASRTYLDLGILAFGAPGRAIVLAFLCVFSYATCIDCVMINREHFMVLWPEANTLLTIMSIVIPALFVCFCSLNEFRPLWNGIGVFLSVIVVIILVFVGALDVGFQVKETSLFHSSTSHLSVGFFSFCLCGHSVLPLVYSRVQNRRKYRRILIIIFAISTTLYVGTGCFGYAMFGNETKSLFTLNLPRHLLVSQLAMGITVINHMLRYILNITPLAQNLEALLPENYRNFSCRMLIRSMLAATTSLAFLSTGYYGPVVSLVGSIVGVAISLIIPTVCFLGIRWNNLPRLRGGLCCIAILVGAFSMIIVIIRSSMSFTKG